MFPVLPVKINSKLLFPLCHNCVHKEENVMCGCTREEHALMGNMVHTQSEHGRKHGLQDITHLQSATLGTE